MDKEDFKKALIAFCQALGYEIAGTDEGEGIYGEITIHKINEEPTWSKWDENKFNFV